MSTSSVKRPLAQAIRDAEAFRDLFPPACYEQWHFAGSLRRSRANVGDIEHVVVPKHGDIEVSGGLFAETEHVNLVMYRLDELVRTYVLTKHLYGGEKPGTTASPRWGDKYRGVDFRGFCHEVWMAAPGALGAQLAIRTGPAGFSQMLVTRLKMHGYLQHEGHVWKTSPVLCGCGWTGSWAEPDFRKCVPGEPRPAFVKKDGDGVFCPRCGRGDQIQLERVNVPDEQTYFGLCRVRYLHPPQRLDPEERR